MKRRAVYILGVAVLALALLLASCAPLKAAIPHLFDAAEAAILAVLKARGATDCGDAPCVQAPTELDRRAVEAQRLLDEARSAEAIADAAAERARLAAESGDRASMADAIEREATAREAAATLRRRLAAALRELR